MDAYIVKHCSQYEGEQVFNGDQVLLTNKFYEKVNKDERKREFNRNKYSDEEEESD